MSIVSAKSKCNRGALPISRENARPRRKADMPTTGAGPHHSASRARTIAGLSGFFTLIQSATVPPASALAAIPTITRTPPTVTDGEGL
jgi:hypothetical protein